MAESTEEPRGILKGAIDLHLHAAPSVFPRAVNDLEAAESASQWGMAGFVLKAHEGSTAERASIANHAAPGGRAVGSIVLNQFVGGLNPLAVEMALALGARVVFLPTIHAANHIRHFGGPTFSRSVPSQFRPVEDIELLDAGVRLRPEVLDILDIVRDAGAVLATGHISPMETDRLVSAAAERGVEKIVVNHPDFAATRMDIETQVALARRGAYIEFPVLYHRPEWAGVSHEDLVARIPRIGAGRFVLSSDFGQKDNGNPWEALAREVSALLRAGLKEQDLDTILRRNPGRLVG